MTDLMQVKSVDRQQHQSMFDLNRPMNTLIKSVLEGMCGDLFVDGTGNGWIFAPPFWLPVGDTTSDAAAYFLKAIQRWGGIVIADETWLGYLEESVTSTTERISRTQYSAKSLEKRTLAMNDISIQRIDSELAHEVATLISPDLILESCFSSVESFVEQGIGFCVLIGTAPVAAATSGFICSDAIEIQVNTHRDFRAKGYAALASQALINHCLKTGLTPHWDTESEISDRLAKSLGYEPILQYAWLAVAPA